MTMGQALWAGAKQRNVAGKKGREPAKKDFRGGEIIGRGEQAWCSYIENRGGGFHDKGGFTQGMGGKQKKVSGHVAKEFNRQVNNLLKKNISNGFMGKLLMGHEKKNREDAWGG